MSPVRLQVTISRFKVRNLPDRNAGGGLLRLLRPMPPDGPLRLQLQWGGGQLLTTGECTDVATDDVAAGRSDGAAHKHWPDSFTFECNLSLDEMSHRRLELRLMRGVGEAAHTLGTVAVPLETLACAPALNDHALREPAEVQPSGARLAFRCRVSEQRGWRLRLRDLELRLQPSALEHDCASAGLTAALFSLAYTFTSGSTDQESHEQLWRAPQTRLLLVGRGEELRLSWGAAGGGGGGGVFGALPPPAGVLGGEASLEWPSLAASREARRKGPGFLGADGFYDTRGAGGGAGGGRPAGGGGESGGAPAEAAAPEAAAVAPGPPPEVPDFNLPPSVVRQASGPPPEALPTIVHDGAFWEVRHGALRLTLKWRRCHTAAAVAAATWRRRASSGPVAAAASDDAGAAEEVETGAAEPGAGSAKAWVVMDKVLSDVQAVLQRRQRQRRRRKRRQRRLLAEAAAAGGVAAHAAAAAAEEEEEGEEDWVGLDAGDEDEDEEDEDEDGAAAKEEGEEGEQGCVVVGVHEELYDHGRVVGTLCGKLAIDLPSVLQPDHGALTEAGHLAHGTPIVYENRNAGSFGSLGGGGSEAARLATLRAQLARAVERGDERGRTSAESALAQLLRTSHKESLFSFVFRDEASLQACRHQMLSLWALLLALLEGRVVGFAVRRCCYELLRLLLHREELGCTLFASAEAGLLDTPTLLRWRALQESTVAWVVETVGDPPAGGDGPALRDLCAEAMARGYFRLPHFARAVLDALQSEDVLVHEPVPEWRGLTFSLDCADEHTALAERGMSEHPVLDWRYIDARARAAMASAEEEAAAPEEVAAARAASARLAGAIATAAWRVRLRRRGHMFCCLFFSWMDVVCESLEGTMPPHYVAWHKLPGYKTLLTCLLLEMKGRPVAQYPEPLVKLTNQLLVCTHLHSLLVKIVFCKCSVHDVCSISTMLNLMSSWMRGLAGRLAQDAVVSSQQDAGSSPVSQPLLRSTFDFGFFFEGMGILFDSDHAQVLLKGIEFLYRHWDLLPETQADELRRIILRRHTSRLQMHWSPQVRSFFGHLLVLRMELPCGWSTAASIATTSGPKELNPQLAAQFARRAASLRLAAQRHAEEAAAAGLSTTAAAATSAAAAAAAPPLAPCEPAGSAPAAWLRRCGAGGAGGAADAVASAAASLRRSVGGRTLSGRGGEATNGSMEAEAMAEAHMLADGVPHALLVYAQPALLIYEDLVQERSALLRRVQELRRLAPHSEVADLDLPQLHWDTSVLDMEEDRVIWVRESELGKDAPAAP